MKRFYISLIIFISVLTTGFVSDRFRNNELDYIQAYAGKILNTEDNNRAIMQAKKLKDIFYNKKNTLLLIISKEHIKNLENDILIMENALKNGDRNTAAESAIQIQVTASYSQNSLHYFY